MCKSLVYGDCSAKQAGGETKRSETRLALLRLHSPFSTLSLSVSRFLCVSLSSLICSIPQTENGPQLNIYSSWSCCSSRSALFGFLFLSIQRKRRKRGEKMQQWRPENAAMTFDEVSMERSKSFVKALQVTVPWNSDLCSLFEIWARFFRSLSLFLFFFICWRHWSR